jgi:RNA polymerase sigma-70 factor (ECF subfamily)
MATDVSSGAQAQGTPVSSLLAAELARLRPALYARAAFLTQDPSAADDLVQETIERALIARDSFRAGTNLGAWVNRILRNLFIDGCRRPRFRPAEDAMAVEAAPPEPPRPSDLLVMQDVVDALSLLTPLDRELFSLKHLERASYKEISRRLGIPANTAGTRLHRSRAKLRAALQPLFEQRRQALAAGRDSDRSAASGQMSLNQRHVVVPFQRDGAGERQALVAGGAAPRTRRAKQASTPKVGS